MKTRLYVVFVIGLIFVILASFVSGLYQRVPYDIDNPVSRYDMAGNWNRITDPNVPGTPYFWVAGGSTLVLYLSTLRLNRKRRT